MSLLDRALDVRPLRVSPEFRRLWIGTSLSAIGGQLALVAVLVQVWDLTGSAVAVGTIGLAQAIPMLGLGLVGGVLADLLDRRRLVLLTTAAQIVAAALLAAQAVIGVGSLALVLALVALQSSGAALGAPARRTFAARLLPIELVPAGVALNHVSFQAAMLTGPAVGGIVAARWGVEFCYALDAASFTAALYGVLGLPPLRSGGPPTGRPAPGAVLAGLRFIASRPVLGGAFATDLLATVLAMPVALFPAINEQRFGGDPSTVGFFLTAIAVGGIVAGGVSGSVTRAARPGVVMLASAAVWGGALASFGLATHLWAALAVLAVAGAADTVSVISRGSIVQLATPDSHRGRVSAVEHVIGVSGPDLGNYRGGLVAGVTSAPIALVSGGLACLLGVGAVAVAAKPLRRFQAAAGTDAMTV